MKTVKIFMFKATSQLIRAFFVLLLWLIPSILTAQDPGGGPDVPIDGGLSLLLAAGSAYGIKKYRRYKESSKKK